jgi:hypothetical protein
VDKLPWAAWGAYSLHQHGEEAAIGTALLSLVRNIMTPEPRRK